VAVEFQRERTKELTEKSPGSFADNILYFATDASDSSSRTFFFIHISSYFECYMTLTDNTSLFAFGFIRNTGDEDVLSLLKKNMKKNASEGSSTKKLVWGAGDALEILELKRHPDFILATDVVYGNDTSKWKALVDTMKRLAGRDTLILIGNVRRYPAGHPLAETTFYTEATKEDFDRAEVPVSSLHPEFRKTGAGSCVIHALRLKRDAETLCAFVKKRKKEKKKEKKEKSRKKSKKKESPDRKV
jgi:hypothetical protein